MAELVWEGKVRDGRKVEPSRLCLPIRTEESIGKGPGWHDRLILGDKKLVLPSLLPELGGKVNLVYIDPPFATGADFSVDGRKAYRDTWRGGFDSYLQWLFETAVLLRELLAADGSLYLHLDANAAHYAKAILDEVFGARCFQREIIWRIGWVSGFKSAAGNWIRNHDTLLFYTRDRRRFTFNKEYLPYPAGYVRRDGRPPSGQGFPIDDVWNASEPDRLDSIQIKSFSGEKVGYPTQKNEGLLARIIKASSNPGELVLDCCCGSGTTAVVASRLGRRFVAADIGRLAIQTTRKRLLALPEGKPFVLQSLGRHERRSWMESTFKSFADYRRLICSLAGARRSVHVGAVDAAVSRADVRALGPGPADVLGWEFEPGVEDHDGRIRLRLIPREIMEAAAVEQADVKPEDFRELRSISASVVARGRTVRVALTGFRSAMTPPGPAASRRRAPNERGALEEIDSWAVDWNHRGAVFRTGWHAARSRKGGALALTAESPPYAKAGRYVVAVKVVDAHLTEDIRRYQVRVR